MAEKPPLSMSEGDVKDIHYGILAAYVMYDAAIQWIEKRVTESFYGSLKDSRNAATENISTMLNNIQWTVKALNDLTEYGQENNDDLTQYDQQNNDDLILQQEFKEHFKNLVN
jgi:hypothetical protein